jgi:predicted membrane channel-forming protein YqfA (hemolysin III family)
MFLTIIIELTSGLGLIALILLPVLLIAGVSFYVHRMRKRTPAREQDGEFRR